MMQRQISIDRDEDESGLEALEEPLKAKKPKENRQGTPDLTCKIFLLVLSVLHIKSILLHKKLRYLLAMLGDLHRF